MRNTKFPNVLPSHVTPWVVAPACLLRCWKLLTTSEVEACGSTRLRLLAAIVAITCRVHDIASPDAGLNFFHATDHLRHLAVRDARAAWRCHTRGRSAQHASNQSGTRNHTRHHGSSHSTQTCRTCKHSPRLNKKASAEATSTLLCIERAKRSDAKRATNFQAALFKTRHHCSNGESALR